MLRKFKIGLPLLALVLGVAASAFTGEPTPKPSKNLTTKFWKLVNLNDPLNPLSYQEITDPNDYEAIDCSGEETVCKMQAQDDGTGHPKFVDQNQDGLPDEDGILVTERVLRNK